MIRTTKHSLKPTHIDKLVKYQEFFDECQKTAQHYLDYLWDNKIEYTIKEEKKYFDLKNDKLEVPTWVSNVYLESKIEGFKSELSGRASKCILNQIIGIIKSATEKRRKRLYVFGKLCDEGVYNERLQQNIDKFQLVKPNLDDINFEFNSICANFEKSDGFFNGFFELCSIGKQFGKIRIPIKFHRNNKKYENWNQMSSFLVGRNFINIRWEKEIELKKEGSEIGCDQGKITVLTLSDKQTTPATDKHGHSLTSIIEKLSAKRKGRKAFKKAQEHRKNFINWSINQINLNGIKHFKLEEIVNINYGRRVSRDMSHWTNTLIRDKVRSRCEVSGVRFTLQSCTYRSQRCSACGLVRKSNRKDKIYVCRCGFSSDADYNASCNHEQILPDIPHKLRKLNLNRKGFYWKESGFYDLKGVQLAVGPIPIINHQS
jgi:transposase